MKRRKAGLLQPAFVKDKKMRVIKHTPEELKVLNPPVKSKEEPKKGSRKKDEGDKEPGADSGQE